MKRKNRILVIEDEEILRFTFKSFLLKEGHEVITAKDYSSAIKLISEPEPDLIIADIILGGNTGIDILRKVKEKGVECPVIMITGQPSIETAAESVRLGAYDYLSKPVGKQDLIKITNRALQYHSIMAEKDRMEAEKEKYRSELDTIFRSVQEGIVTVDEQMKVTKVNDAFERICGLNGKKIIGRRLSDVSGQCRQTCCHVLEKVILTQKGVKTSRLECHHHDRNKQIVVLTGSPLRDLENNFSGAALVIRDVTRESDLEGRLKPREKFMNIIGRSKKMQELYSLLEDLADSDTTILITGESGTGKELVAEALHYGSHRAQKPFVKVNCSALADSLLESELFGHIKGAFTGAVKDQLGRFEMADKGSILLDEIGDISPRLQLKLLRVIQEKEFERVGESTPVKVNVRIISSTNQLLKELVRTEKFRADLYYRLKVVEVNLPPLRERIDDIALLVEHFCKLFNKRFNKEIGDVSDDVIQIFSGYPWPGNIRELEHVLERAFVLCHTDFITVDHLPSEIRTYHKKLNSSFEENFAVDIKDILQALEMTGGNKAKAARLLGINRKTIYRKLSHHDSSDH
ncbi:sigma 54-interacting transcriptional regulator [Desulfobacula sp.]|uniref:sigma-54 dependent transcriptional regulator n=1 Tax=Desulfobacula sp. TaxID=2593537 RepID=UPI0026032BD2|nr:sigma 54-interacting transcriptional regulator [Desulfobacula sp.]